MLKALVFQLLESTVLSSRCFTIDSTCAPYIEDGDKKQAQMVKEMTASGPEMGSLMDQLVAQRKAEEAAKAGKK